ncbi:MAG: GAF domain-containing protein, partial [Chloroflexi bacterium]|nr:GAF domain-containing protein [Chloroflexota bacterium]
PLSITALVNSMVAKQARIDSANQRLLTTASQTAVSIDDFLNNTLNNIRAEAGIMGAAYDWAYYRRLPVEDRSSLGILGEAKAHELLKTYRDKAPLDIASYALLDMDGQIMFEYPASDHNRDESNQSYFETVIETGRPYISPVEFSAEDGEAYLYFSALVYDHSGERFGVLRAQHHAAVLQTLIARSTGSIGGQSFAVLFDENHLHLAHGSAPEALYKLTDLPAADEVAALQAAQRLPDWPLEELSTDLPDLDADLKNALADPFFTAIDIATGNRLNQAAVSKTDAQPWLVAFFQPQDVFLASIQSQIRHTVWLVSLLMIIVTFVAITVAGLITRSIVRLEAVAAQIAAGDIIAQAPVESNDEIGALARAFNLMTEQMRDLIATLEQRVAERTRALEISNNVSRRLSTILDQQELVQAVVQQMQQAFGYYHAHIYLFDEAGENLVMVSGTGEAGRTMLARRHQNPAGQGLIGQAGQTHNVVLAPDVSREKGWLPNPLLPDTKAEVAVPIISGERVLGVLDVQQDVVGGLTETDVRLLQSVANQTAIGLQNARLYARTQQLAAREGQINVIGQKIQSATTVEEALQTAVRELGRALNAKETLVRLKSTKNAENGRSEN